MKLLRQIVFFKITSKQSGLFFGRINEKNRKILQRSVNYSEYKFKISILNKSAFITYLMLL